MRLPDPIANTTTEAYLAYKAGVLNIGDLKPSLYDPYLHYDAWLAYWAGLVDTYPIHDVGKNLYNKATATSTGYYHQNISNEMPVEPGLTYTFNVTEARNYAAAYLYDSNGTRTRTIGNAPTTHTLSFTVRNNEVKVVLDFYAELNVDVSTYDFTGVQLELGSTATPYEPYTGTPEILTDEEALVAYLSGVTNTYPEEYSDPIDARITGYLRYLVSARFGRPDYPVNNIEFYLSLMKPPIVTNETPSANIELDDTAWAELIDVKMYGDTSQQTYTGKNLFDIDQYTNAWIRGGGGAASLEKVDSNTLRTTNKISQTNNFAFIPIPNTNAVLGKTITLSSQVKFGSGATTAKLVCFWMHSGGLDSQIGSDTVFNTDGNYSLTVNIPDSIPSGATNVGYGIYASGNNPAPAVGTYVDYSNIQVEVGSTVTSFEPYVGGVPAPNPDYPQPVQTVTGRQTVKVQKIEDVSLAQDSTGGGSYDSDTQTYTSTTRTGVNAWCKKYEVENIESANFFTTNMTSAEYRCVFSNSDVSTSADMVSLTNGSGSGSIAKGKHTVLNSANRKYLYVSFRTLTTGTSATLVEPRIGFSNSRQEYEVNLGKNLIQSEFRQGTYNNASDLRRITTQHGVFLPAGATATISFELDTTTYRTVVTGLTVDGVTDSIFYNSGWINVKSFTFAAPQSGYYFLTVAYRQETSESRLLPTSGVVSNLQLELGSTATSYAPYFTPIELCKIGDYQDRIYRSEGTWYLEKTINHGVKDVAIYSILADNTSSATAPSATGSFQIGSWDWSFYNNTIANARFSENLGVYKLDENLNGNAASRTMEDGTFCQRQGTNDRLYFRNSAYAGKSGNEVRSIVLNKNGGSSFWWIMSTSTTTQITNAALVAQLDALAAAKSYNDKTYITVEATGPNLPALLKVEAGEYR